MKTAISLFLIATLAIPALAAEKTPATKRQVSCKNSSDCPIPPMPPMPPAPPAPPVPPMPDGAALPELPPLPPVPAPPKAPVVPAAAHAMCEGKAVGDTVTYTPREGETMQGHCAKQDGKMRFDLFHYVSTR